MKKCTRCGEENPDNKIWCICCGEPLPVFPGETADDDLLSGLHGDSGKQAFHIRESGGGVGNYASGIPHSETTDENPWDRGGTAPNGATYCGYCGKPMTAGVRYCTHCGHRREGAVPNNSGKPRIWRWAALLAALAVLVSLIGSILFAFGNRETTEAPVPPKAAESSQDSVSREHYYQVFHNVLTWQEAERACEAMGGHLAAITSAETQRALESLNSRNECLWIGASRDSSGNWAWVTGEPWEYANWDDDNSPSAVSNESCAALCPEGWNTLAGDDLYGQSGYICEWVTAGSEVIQDATLGWFYCITVGGRADWRIRLANDGTFNGIFEVWDWGDNGHGYSKGTSYVSGSSGKFSEVAKVNEYTYRMVVDRVEKTLPADETYIAGDARYVVESENVIDTGSEFYLYLPGVSLSELPQDLIESVNRNAQHTLDEITPNTYILYNPCPESSGGSLVFISTVTEEKTSNQNDAEKARQMTSLTTYAEDGTVWYHHLFSWDENGRLIQVQDVTDWDNIRTWTFQYNERGQLLLEEQSVAGYSFVCQENTYSADGKLLSSRAAAEDGYVESTYQYDSGGRLFKVIQTDDYSRSETTVTDYNSEGKPLRRECVETVLSTGAQNNATEQIEYDNLGRKTNWRYSGTDGEYGMTYRHDIKPFVICTDETGRYTLLLTNEDETSSWTIDVGVHYTLLEDNGVLNFRNANADVGMLEADADGYLTRISFKDGTFFEFEYSGSGERC